MKKGVHKKQRKPRFSVTFHRPKTFKKAREPKYPRQRCAAAVPPKFRRLDVLAQGAEHVQTGNSTLQIGPACSTCRAGQPKVLAMVMGSQLA